MFQFARDKIASVKKVFLSKISGIRRTFRQFYQNKHCNKNPFANVWNCNLLHIFSDIFCLKAKNVHSKEEKKKRCSKLKANNIGTHYEVKNGEKAKLRAW